METFFRVVEKWTGFRFGRGSNEGSWSPVRIRSENGFVVCKSGNGVVARRDDPKKPDRDDEIFRMAEDSRVPAVSFEAVDGGQYLAVVRNGEVSMEADRSELALWEVEGFIGGEMKLKNWKNGGYLRIQEDGRVSAEARKATGGSPVLILHALGWKSRKPRRCVVLRSARKPGFIAYRGGKVEFGSRKQLITEQDMLYMDYNPFTCLASFLTGNGRVLKGTSNSDLALGRLGWFKVENANDYHALSCPNGYLSVSSSGELTLSKETTPTDSNMFFITAGPTSPDTSSESAPVSTKCQKVRGGVRIVNSSVSVPTRAQLPFEVVKDWERLYTYTGKIDFSQILDKAKNNKFTVADDDFLIQLVQKHHFFTFKKLDPMILEAHVDHKLLQVKTVLLESKLLLMYTCDWSTEKDPENPKGCLLHLRLEFQPSIPIPGFILDGLISKDTVAVMRELRAESIRRSKLN
eukprot:CAMPEP_0184739182 /NCGR_PEP_ID=MMETSP0315-20130426/2027_1 /TAXON_ID=101924 /ORGANISM="Rhodosorus marinus, Strain UTEX LB 2760" /LENGTH=462 /DNA_ID=CAMNT_0027207735 /DNA_START=161 /DNA_END=1549 /DNA_ORIENTATION=-